MGKYMLIESRDPFDSNDVTAQADLAKGLAKEGHAVTYFLVENGVLPARRCTESARLKELHQAGVEVLADEFALRERGITRDRLADGVTPAALDTIVDRLAEGTKTLWH